MDVKEESDIDSLFRKGGTTMTSRVIIHATIAEYNQFFDHDDLVSVRTGDLSPYILQDGRRIFLCTIRHPELTVEIPDRKVFSSIGQLKKFINKHRED